jgi:hypothetical protein
MAAQLREEVVVLVKAVPQVGARHGETVCCAGVTRDFEWRRLYPIRFRRLQNDAKFTRWQFLQYEATRPTHDVRIESRHVFEDKLSPGPLLTPTERVTLVSKMTRKSAKHASELGQTLALVRPSRLEFSIKPRKREDHEALCSAYELAASQKSFIDPELKAFRPPPFHFRVRFEDADGMHNHECGDWETIATFTKWSDRYGEERAIKDLTKKYNEEYFSKGMVVALGTLAKRPQTWTLLGMIRADESAQRELF